jgi:hypothetical protein
MGNEPAPLLPFSHVNLTRNPFGELTSAETVHVALLEPQDALRFLESPKTCIQFIGEKGRGKTTHLLDLCQRIPDAVYVHYEEASRPQIPQGRILVLDEFQRLNWRKRRQAYRRAQTLILGTHVNYATEIDRAGFRLRTIEVPLKLDPQRLQQIVQLRIEAFRRNEGAVPFLRLEEADLLLRMHGSNLRSILHHLYHCLQDQQSPGPIGMDILRP